MAKREQSQQYAEFDSLTGLYSKTMLLSILSERFASSAQPPALALLYMEFDELARFNESFGYEIDDILLEKLAKRLQVHLEDELFARVGTYRFAIATDYTDKEKLKRLAETIVTSLREPFNIEGTMFYITVTIGIASAMETVGSAKMLLKYAESAMQQFQKDGTNHIGFYKPADEQHLKRELRLMKDIPGAIDRGEFYMVYQPQYLPKRECYTGAEVLTRWRHPQLGDISPEHFIPLAEKSGMIVPLTIFILIETSKMFERLEANGIDDFTLSVNVPASVLLEQSFLDTVAFLQQGYQLPKGRVIIEIMEDTIPENIDSFVDLLKKLKEMGIGIAIDDFGTGNTSLHYLMRFPADALKVDRSFVRNIHTNQKVLLLFSAIRDMANALHMKMVAEGVEESAEAEVMKSFGDIVIQGYYYSKPIEADALISLVQRRPKSF